MINEQTIRQWWYTLHGDGKIAEVRILGSGKKTYSGYFEDAESLIAAVRGYDGYGIYATINEVSASCWGRTQTNTIIQSPKSTTSDTDIASRTTILIDVDPRRASDTNATDEEIHAAHIVAGRVYKFLDAQGFEKPVVAFSANGYHLYYRINIGNTVESANLIRDFLLVLDMMFSDERAAVDTSVFNASRIAKIIGTSSNKGVSTQERPQRQSTFVKVPTLFLVTDEAYVQKVAALLPKPEQPSRLNNYSKERFDLDGFINAHSIGIAKRSRFQGGEKLVLDCCPFDQNHKAPDAALFRMDSGAIVFKCLHNSCQQYTWHDFRLRFDPQAYDREYREEYHQKRAYNSQAVRQPVEPIKEDERGKKWLSMGDIQWVDPSQIVSIPSGIIELDRKIMGFSLGDVTILSGLSGSGKTTILDHFILNAVHRGYKVAAWSGELQGFRFQAWLDQMAAGKGNVVAKPGYDALYYAPRHICEKINCWLDGKFWLYNNEYGESWCNLFPDIREAVSEKGVRLVLLDNLMALDLDEETGTANEKETRLIKDLKRYAKKEGVHIILVCHPRKEQSFQLLRKESIAGTANLTNLCDNLLISHRVGNDFERRAKDFFGSAKVEELMSYDVVMEVAKNRSMGVVDALVGLFYERETRRIKNDKAENIIYGWDDTPPIYEYDEEDDLPL